MHRGRAQMNAHRLRLTRGTLDCPYNDNLAQNSEMGDKRKIRVIPKTSRFPSYWRVAGVVLCAGELAHARRSSFRRKGNLLPAWMGQVPEDESAPLGPTTSTFSNPPLGKTNDLQKGHLHLDFAGRIETHVSGSPAHDDSRPPLMQAPDYLPSILCAADYDFSKRWYGATRFSTTLRFFCGQSRRLPAAKGRILIPDEAVMEKQTWLRTISKLFPTNARLSNLRPTSFDITREQGLTGGINSSVVVACRWQSDVDIAASNPGSVVQIRTVDVGSTSATIAVPFCRWFRWECSLSNGCKLSVNSFGSKTGSPNVSLEKDDWWIPNVRVDALGQMESKNEVCLPAPMGGQFGLRLTLSRRLNWSALGFLGDSTSEPETTHVRLDIQGLGADCRFATIASMMSQLERPLAAAQLVVRHNVAVGAR